MGGADLILVINVGFCVLMFLHKYSRNSFRILFLLLLLINMDYLYWNKHQLIGMLIDVGLNKLVSSYNVEAVDLAKQLESMVVQVLGGEKVSIHANGSSLPPKSSEFGSFVTLSSGLPISDRCNKSVH